MLPRIIVISFLALFFVEQVAAHSGRTNSSGCHNDRKNGGYHCHNSGSSYSSSSYLLNSSSTKRHSPSSSLKNSYNKVTVKEVQRLLVKGGYSPGPIDGIAGAKTVKAIMRFQGDKGITKDGLPSSSLLAKLRREI